jgi:hypothetical protein
VLGACGGSLEKRMSTPADATQPSASEAAGKTPAAGDQSGTAPQETADKTKSDKAPPDKTVEKATDEKKWSPPEPDPKKFDWIRIVSDEWLKGDITVLRDDSFEFDSDELDDLKFDWDDVKEVRSPRMNTLVFEDRTTATGTLWIRDDVVLLREASGRELRFKRKDLLAIIPGEPRERNFWSGKFSIGVMLRGGNTRQMDFSSNMSLRRRSLYSRLDLSYLGALGSFEGEETVNNHRLDARYDIFLTRRFYVTPLSANGYRDTFQNIDVRVVPAAGVGYHLIKQKGIEWDVSVGGGYKYERYVSVEPGEADDNGTGAALVGTSAEIDLTKKVELKLLYSAQIGIPDTLDTNQHAEVGLDIDLIGSLDLDLLFVWDRVGQPQAEDDGVVPKNDDYRISIGFGFDF